VRGEFLEKLLEFEVRGSYIAGGRRFPAMPVRGVTSRSLPREFFGDTPVRCSSFGLVQLMVLDALVESSPELAEPVEKYLRTAVPWLKEFAQKQLSLAPGHPLRLGGFRWAKRTPEGDALATLVRNTGRSFAVSLRREADPDWRMAVQWCGEGRELAKEEGELVDLGHHLPLSYSEEGPLRRGQVRLPPGEWTLHREDERVMAVVVGMYAQVKAFSQRRAEVFHIRVGDLDRALRRQRREGASAPCDIPIDELGRVERRIAWRSPESGETERGLSWVADATLPRRRAVAAAAET
jgi:hypothetical protein